MRARCYRLPRAASPGQSYNIGGSCERSNIAVVRLICALMDELAPNDTGCHEGLITFVSDRPGHDLRYAIDAGKITTELGWQPRETFESGLRKTVTWYLDNRHWWEPIRKGSTGANGLEKSESDVDLFWSLAAEGQVGRELDVWR